MATCYSRNAYLICAIGISYLSNNSEHGGWKHDFPK